MMLDNSTNHIIAERMRQLRRRIERARPLYMQYNKGELRVMSEKERRQVEEYPTWMKDLEELKQGRLPPPRPSLNIIHNNNNINNNEEKKERKKHVISSSSGDKLLELREDNNDDDDNKEEEEEEEDEEEEEVKVEKSENGHNSTERQKEEKVKEIVETKNNTQTKINVKQEGKTPIKNKKSSLSDGLIGDPEVDKEIILQRLSELKPESRESFIKKYVERIIDTDEVRKIKKKFDTANNVRQKILSGAVKSPSKAQLEKISELSELRRTINLFKQNEKKEFRRLSKIFLQNVEKENEENIKKDLNEKEFIESSEVNTGDENNDGVTETFEARESISSPQLRESSGENEIQRQNFTPPILTEISDQIESTSIGNDGTPSLAITESTFEKNVNDKEIIIQSINDKQNFVTNLASSNEESNQIELNTNTIDSNNTVTNHTSIFSDPSHEINNISTNKIIKKETETKSNIDWSKLKYSKNKVGLDIKAWFPLNKENQEKKSSPKKLSPQKPQQQQQQQQQQQKNKKNNNQDENDKIKDNENLTIPDTPGKKKRREEKGKKFSETLTHVIGNQLQYVRLHIPLLYNEYKNSCNFKNNIDFSKLEAKNTLVLQQIESEFKYLLQNPVSRITVTNFKVLVDDKNNNNNNNNNNEIVAQWFLLVSPSDGPLAGQLISIIVAFSPLYPFIPPLFYSTVFLPLNSIMISESGQSNTLRLPWIYNSPQVGYNTSKVSGGRLAAWKPEYGIYKLLIQLSNFFNAEAFANAREALGEELYSRSVAEARLMCGTQIIDFITRNNSDESLSKLEMVNGPFLILSSDNSNNANIEGKNKKEKKEEEEKEEKEKKEEEINKVIISSTPTVCYYEGAMEGKINGPFEGCWGHLLMMPPTMKKEELQKNNNNNNILVTTLYIKDLLRENMPEIEITALSQEFVTKESDSWAESILNRNEKSPVLKNLNIPLNVSEETKSISIQFFFDIKMESSSPRCIEDKEKGITYVYLPINNNLNKDEISLQLTWAIVLRLQDGSSAEFNFIINENKNENKIMSNKLNNSSDIFKNNVSTSSLYSIFSRDDIETLTEPQGVLCEVLYPKSLANCFIPEEVIVYPGMVISENVFDTYFNSFSKKKKFFFASTPIASCTFYLPLTNQYIPLSPDNLICLKNSITQLHRNPEASIAYTAPFKIRPALRFFANILKSLEVQYIEQNDTTEIDVNKRMKNLITIYMGIIFTFIQLVQSDIALQELCYTISNSENPFNLPRIPLDPLKDDIMNELVIIEWLLALWCNLTVSNSLRDSTCDNTPNTSKVSNNFSNSLTFSLPTKMNWLESTNKLILIIKEKKKDSLLLQAQSHINLFGACILNE